MSVKKSVGRSLARPARRRRAGRAARAAMQCGSKAGGRALARELAAQHAAGLRASLAQVGAPGLEQGDALGAPGEVVARGVEERAEQRGPKLGMLLRERIGDAGSAPVGSRSGSRSRPGSPGSTRLRLTTASKPRSRITSSARRRNACSRRQSPALAGCLRKGRRKVLVVAVDAPDLLDQVGLAADVVVAVDRNLGHQVVALALDPEAEPLQVGGAQLGLDPHPQQRARRGARAAALGAQAAARRRRRSSRAPASPRTSRPSASTRCAGRGSPARGEAASRTGWTPPSATPAFARCAGCSPRSRSRPRAARGWSSSETSETWPPMIPAIPEGPSRSQTRTDSASKVRSTPSRVVICSPSARGADDQRAVRAPDRGRTRAAAAR